jgi:hypothetical protein
MALSALLFLCWRVLGYAITAAGPCNSRSYNGLKLRFTATVGEEPEVEVGLI